MKEWVKMPSYWIRDRNNPILSQLRWIGPEKSDQIAALMLYMVLAQHANNEPTLRQPSSGMCQLTYTELGEIANISRQKISGGLDLLCRFDLISRTRIRRDNFYHLINIHQERGWAKLPARGLYSDDLRKHKRFQELHLRNKVELDALMISDN